MVETKDNTKEFLSDLQRKQIEFVTQGASVIQSNARALAPKDTGNLINSIQIGVFVQDAKAISDTGPTADYAKYVEYGTGVFALNGQGRKTPWTYQNPEGNWFTTRGAKAQPFMEPGFQKSISSINAIARRVLK